MAKRGFEQASGSNAVTETSGSIGYPGRWFPNEVFRFYSSLEYPRILAFVTAMLDDRAKEYRPNLREPLLAAGAFVFPERVGEWQYWWARWHGWMPSRRDDGVVNKASASLLPDEQHGFEHVLTLAVPLVDVQDSAGLSAKIIQPLADSFKEWHEPEQAPSIRLPSAPPATATPKE